MAELRPLCPGQLRGFTAGARVKSRKMRLPCSFSSFLFCFFVFGPSSYFSRHWWPQEQFGLNSRIFLHRSCRLTQASQALSMRGQNAVGAGLGAGTLLWLGFLKGQRLCADFQSGLGFCGKRIQAHLGSVSVGQDSGAGVCRANCLPKDLD